MQLRTGIVSVEANQYLDGKLEGTPLITCTGGDVGFGRGRALEAVPDGLEVFGPTSTAVRHPKGHLIQVSEGDWVLVAPNGNIIVVSDTDFKNNYLDFLGVETK